MFGKSSYDIAATAKDNRWIALLTFGEGYHNFHHRFPSDYRNGVRWYQWDPSKWCIFLCAKLGLASQLKKISRFRILEAKLAAENEILKTALKKKKTRISFDFDSLEKQLSERYEVIRSYLNQWETRAKEYHNTLNEKHDSRKRLKEAKKLFFENRREWKFLSLSAVESI